ncbi:DUF475 domain-containing protein [Bartonella sp. M0177]|uniref:DUF475 domain-containing protein n=1 Tax=Bartonella sp. M0177 TaxID=2750940 RepID=UPI0018DE0C7A|nr:DUF475 domain-containing protein [Bartonella sp. M0177]MBI0003881.1 DUF475 domain-containing protein [Bartonella sp. M0177]
MSVLRYFTGAFIFTVVGLSLGMWLGYVETGSTSGIFEYLFICCVLGVLEISLSFDNSIINARILRDMSPVWEHRFLTWGIVIAVFGMRVIFPLIVVAFAAWISPLEALKLAIWEPQHYAEIMTDAHVGIAAFGGTFLFMVGLKYFFDPEKDTHWILFLEGRAKKYASIHGIQIAITLILVLIFSSLVKPEDDHTFLVSAIYGLLAFITVEGLGVLMDARKHTMENVYKGGIGAFVYLEVLDASFSFDGVIGAFALSTNLFVIAIGLGIGAFYVRSMTILLVDKGTLAQYRYLEHGAFYAILVLAFIMYLQTIIHIPEVVTGVIGMVFILTALYSSIRFNRNHPDWHLKIPKE